MYLYQTNLDVPHNCLIIVDTVLLSATIGGFHNCILR